MVVSANYRNIWAIYYIGDYGYSQWRTGKRSYTAARLDKDYQWANIYSGGISS
jgi:hypothetical protein